MTTRRRDTDATDWPGGLQLLRALLLIGGGVTLVVGALSGSLSALARTGLVVGGLVLLGACAASGRRTRTGRLLAVAGTAAYLLVAGLLAAVDEITASVATFAVPAVTLVVLLTPWAASLYDRR